jgi:N-formylglutamate amidohydrolase
MKADKNPLVETRKLFGTAQRQFDCACENAGRILEAHLNEIALDVQRTAGSVASLESALELYEGLENARLARSTRTEIDAAMDVHRGCVDGAKHRLRHAWQDYHARIIAAAAALAAPSIEAGVHVPV